MKKFILSLGLILILACCGWLGGLGFGAAPALAQPLPPPDSGSYCDPYYNECNYYNYYSAPYSDPATQFFYYGVPEILEEHREHERREHWREREHREEWEGHERREHRDR